MIKDDSIGRRLVEARGSQSQGDFAQRIGVHRNSLSRYESGENEPSAEVLRKIAELGYNISWLLTGSGPKQLDLGAPVSIVASLYPDTDRLAVTHAKRPPQAASEAELPDNWVKIKRYGVELAAGGGKHAGDHVSIDELAFRRQYLEFIGVYPKNAAIVRVRGDSMEPELRDGDSVLIDTSDTAIHPPHRDASRRRRYAISQHGADGDALRCKFVESVRADGSEFTQISSLNPDYPAELLDSDKIRVIGRIRWSGHTWF